MNIHINSFGFKHKLTIDADVLLDVRFLPNPFYIPELKETSGLSPATAAYVLGNKAADEFLRHVIPLIIFYIEQYSQADRSDLTCCIGCTGGQHRSVAIAEAIASHLADLPHTIEVIHRNLPNE